MEETRHDESTRPATRPSTEKPLIWPVFVVVGGALAVTIAAQIALTVALVAAHAARGGGFEPESIERVTEDFFMSPVGLIVAAGIGQIAFLGAVWIATVRPRGSRSRQLGLRGPELPARDYAAFVVGTGVPVAIGVGFSWALSLVVEPVFDPKVIWSKITVFTFVPYVLFIALAPGFIEEITFRGFVQRRLLHRWSPGAAIACSSILFAVAHPAPHGIRSSHRRVAGSDRLANGSDLAVHRLSRGAERPVEHLLHRSGEARASGAVLRHLGGGDRRDLPRWFRRCAPDSAKATSIHLTRPRAR